MAKGSSGIELISRAPERIWSTFVLAMTAIGLSVGAGNYWRFSWRAANYGGGSFLLAYLIWLIVLTPIIMAEYGLGKIGRGGPLHGPFNVAEKRKTLAAFGGLWMAWCTLMTMCYYWVVTGWIFYYMIHAILGSFFAPDFDAMTFWKSFGFTPLSLVPGLIVVAMNTIIVAFGVKGIATVSSIMNPLLFVFTMGLAIYTITLPGADKGLEFFMIPKAEALLDPATWMQSLSQVIWSIGIAWAIFICAGAWMRRNDDITLISFVNASNDTAVAWMAGMAIIPLIFAISAAPYEDIKAAGTGLAFVVLPQLFRRIGPPIGHAYAAFFFVAFWFAAMTSCMCMHEVALRPLKDLGLKKSHAAIITAIVYVLGGLPTALSADWLDYYDTVWGVIGFAFALAFLAMIAGFLTNTAKFREKIVDMDIKPFIKLGKWWDTMVRANLVIPVVFFLWWIVYWEWIKGWGAGLHTYYTFPGFLILVLGGMVLYLAAKKIIEKQVGKAG